MSVRWKFFWALLSMSLFSVLFGLLFSVYSLKKLENEVGSTNQKMASELREQTFSTLNNINMEVVSSFSRDYSERINGNFERYRKQTEALASFVSYLYSLEEGFVVDAAGEGEDRKVAYLPGTDRSAVKEELRRIGMVRDYIKAMPDYDKDALDVVDIFIVTESGMCLDGTGEDISEDEYTDLRELEWYTGAASDDNAYWAKPFIGPVTGISKISCGVPFYDRNGNLKGVATTNIAIDNIHRTVFQAKSNLIKYTFLLDGEGNMLINPDGFELDSIRTKHAKEWGDLLKNPGSHVMTVDGLSIGLAPVAETNWNVGLVFSYNKITDAANATGDSILESSGRITEMIHRIIVGTMGYFALLVIIFSLMIMLISRRLSASITKPLNMLTEQAVSIGGGNFEQRIENINTKDEIGVLADNFNIMIDRLKEYVKNLETVTADKERIATELDIARNIQASMLPSIFPPFPNETAFDIFAMMQPAKEVGGDFYDFFMLDSGKLGVVIADVSGKGVPAALFMVIAKTLIKNHAQSGETPAQIFTSVNAQLCENNDMSMFVTVFMGILEIKSGKFTFVNGGHNPPVIKREDGVYKYLNIDHGVVLAIMDNIKYREYEMILEVGDILYLYTDGVTEANSKDGRMFGEEGLVQALNKTGDMPVKEMLPFIKQQIDIFAGEAEQFDDITMLALKVNSR